MKHNKKTLFTTIIAALITAAAAIFLTVTTIIPVIANINIDPDQATFLAEIDGHNYKCYRLKDGDTPISGVAIAWNEDPATCTGTEGVLNIPDTVSYSGANYTIKGIATAGFRYCQFSYINLPDTIEIIKEEAFAYCEKLVQFTMPYLVTKIEPSTFMDCRSLEIIKYVDENGNESLENVNITRIEDHAFINCVSLKTFTCPTNLVYLGESCFQKCLVIPSLFFPKAQRDANDNITNKITIKPYAFADCTGLLSVYFEPNMDEIDDYAFVDCNTNLTFRYYGYPEPTFYNAGTIQNHWRDKNIASNLKTKYDIITNHPEIDSDPDYPCFHYSIVETPALLDSRYDDTHCQIYVIDQAEVTSEGKYAIINAFETPTETNTYFNVSTGALTIPETLGGYKVKVIDLLAFAYNLDIKSVAFSANLVQIRHHAFYQCTNIKTMSFNNYSHLKEVSYFAFQDKTFTNTQLTVLNLPDSLEFVGDYSFANFTKVNTFHMSTSMRAIGDLAFYFLGNGVGSNANVDLTLPKSLNDTDAEKAYFKHQPKAEWVHSDYTRWYAIGKYAFEGAKCLRTAVMETDSAHVNDDTYNTSMFSNAFKDCANLFRFKSNGNLKYVGKDAFKGCSSLKEIFLSTKKAENAPEDYPWCIDENYGTYGGTLFFGASPELVVYLDGPKAPRLLDSYSLNNYAANDPTGKNAYQIEHMWNAETSDSYNNEVQGINSDTHEMQNRSHVPTYYGIDFDNDITYWKPSTGGKVSQPTTLNEYNAGIVSIVKTGTDEYTIARYYYSQNSNTGYHLVDLTNIPTISTTSIHKLKTIGPEAFAVSGAFDRSKVNNDNSLKAPGLYFVLPESLTKIDERAFYRRVKGNADGNGHFGVRLITYRKESNGKVLAADGTTELDYPTGLSSIIDTINGQTAKDRRGYCVFSNNLTYIGKDAFYNHIFSSIYLSGSITFIGHGAFYVQPHDDSNQKTTTTSITMASNSNFSVINDGLYYTGGGNSKKMLMYQLANSATTTLNIAAETKAIGLQSCANTKYQTINLNSGLTTIYGSGFARNTSLLTVNTVSSLRYINAFENASGTTPTDGWTDDGYDEVFDNSVAAHFDNIDFRDVGYSVRPKVESQFGSFYNCSKMTSFNFLTLSELRKIGWAAFYNCKALINMTGSTEYVYKKYDGSIKDYTGVSRTNKNDKVLDLSGCTHLRSIDMYAFYECQNIKFLHLPNLIDTTKDESALYIGYDPEARRVNGSNAVQTGSIFKDSSGIQILVGNTASYASNNYGASSHKVSTHYPGNCFGKSNNIYYYFYSASDIINNSGSGAKYWTKYNNQYILIDNEGNAKKFLQSFTPDAL